MDDRENDKIDENCEPPTDFEFCGYVFGLLFLRMREIRSNINKGINQRWQINVDKSTFQALWSVES